MSGNKSMIKKQITTQKITPETLVSWKARECTCTNFDEYECFAERNAIPL